MAKSKARLGKGLGALIPEARKTDNESAAAGSITELDPRLIRKNPYQPRTVFDPDALAELKQSIKENGLIQPIAVREVDDGYELIAGERRLRSVLDLDMKTVPAIILDIDTKEEMLEYALIENVQREQLNVVEQALSYQRLTDECGLTIETVAQKVGKNRSTINNILRVLKLPRAVLELLREDALTTGHAKALLALPDTSSMIAMGRRAARGNWSVRKTEQAVQAALQSSDESETQPTEQPFHRQFVEMARSQFGTQVKLRPKKSGGSIELEYYNDDDLFRIYELIEKLNRDETQ